MISVPDSVAYYWRDPVNEAAINVLGGSSDVPADLSLDEAERFELAALAARRVKVEFWRMLRQLRVAIWDGAVRLSFPDARLLGYGEHQAVANAWEQYADPSSARAWEARATAAVYQLRGGAHLFTRVQLSERDSQLGLQLYHWGVDETTAVTDDLDLGTEWSDDGEGRRTTISRLFTTPRGSEQFDVDPLQVRARAALNALVAAL